MNNDPFKPYKVEKTIKVEVTAKEAHLIRCLRHYSFGKFLVYKVDGMLVRVEPNESILLNEEEGLKLNIG